MVVNKKFVTCKDSKSKTITYKEYVGLKGYNVKPRNNYKIENMIKVDEMVIIHPNLIDNLVHRKCHINIDRLVKYVTYLYDSDDEDPSGNASLALNEVAKFRSLLVNKYKDYLEASEYKELMKKLEILKTEIMLKQELSYENEEISRQGKGGR